MKLLLQKSSAPAKPLETLVVFVSCTDEKKINVPKTDKTIVELIQAANAEGALRGKPRESIFFRQARVADRDHLLTIGMGKGPWSAEDGRIAGAYIFNSLKSHRCEAAAIDLDTLGKAGRDAEFIQGIVEGILLSRYEFTDHKSKVDKKPDPHESRPHEISLMMSNPTKEAEEAVRAGRILSEGTNFARWLGDHSANFLTPTSLAKAVQERAKGTRVKVQIWDKARIKKERFGGLMAVSAGSSQEPRFIIIRYDGAPKGKKPVVFVGKGLTFDSGGISIKPSANMDEMKYDMCGGAAVVGTVMALAELKAKVNVIGMIPATENMPGPSAVKPGDVMVARNGKTVEILNTDAEGRLVLSDALVYACEQKPQAVFNVATLTGAILVALGNIFTGVFTRDSKVMKRIQTSADAAGERVWLMPVVDEHLDDMKGLHADLSNISSGKGAGSSTAAAFLEQFVEKGMPYAHFDIAGTAWNVHNRLPYAPKRSASGVMVRTFVELAKSYF